MNCLLPILGVIAISIAFRFPKAAVLLLGLPWLIVMASTFLQGQFKDLPGIPGTAKFAQRYGFWLKSPYVARNVSQGLAVGIWFQLAVGVIVWVQVGWVWGLIPIIYALTSVPAIFRLHPALYLQRGVECSEPNTCREAFILLDYARVYWPDEWLNVWPAGIQGAFLRYCQQRSPQELCNLVIARSEAQKAPKASK